MVSESKQVVDNEIHCTSYYLDFDLRSNKSTCSSLSSRSQIVSQFAAISLELTPKHGKSNSKT